MLPQKNRLRKKEEFDNVYKKGKIFAFGEVVLRVVKNDLGFSRIGFVVSTKFSKKAVERNRVKRQLREIFKKKRNLLKQSADIVVMVKKTDKTTLSGLQADAEKSLKRAKLTE